MDHERSNDSHPASPRAAERGSALSLLAAAVAGGFLVLAVGSGPGSPLHPVLQGLDRSWDSVTRVFDGPGPGPR